MQPKESLPQSRRHKKSPANTVDIPRRAATLTGLFELEEELEHAQH
jgi:hypothetical protein